MRSRKLYVSELVKRYQGTLLIAIMLKECAYVYEPFNKDIEEWYNYQVKRWDETDEYIRIYI